MEQHKQNMGNFRARHTITRFCMSALVSWYEILHFHPQMIRRFKLIKNSNFSLLNKIFQVLDYVSCWWCARLISRLISIHLPLFFLALWLLLPIKRPNFSLLSPTSHANQLRKYSSLLPATLTFNLHSTIFIVCPPSLSFYSIHTMAICYDVAVSVVSETITTCCDDWDGITKFLSLFYTHWIHEWNIKNFTGTKSKSRSELHCVTIAHVSNVMANKKSSWSRVALSISFLEIFFFREMSFAKLRYMQIIT